VAAGLIRQIWDRMHVNPPGVAVTLVLLSVHAVSLIGTLVIVVALALAGVKRAPIGQAQTKPAAAPACGCTAERAQAASIPPSASLRPPFRSPAAGLRDARAAGWGDGGGRERWEVAS
jgi:hypothetical protein